MVISRQLDNTDFVSYLIFAMKTEHTKIKRNLIFFIYFFLVIKRMRMQIRLFELKASLVMIVRDSVVLSIRSFYIVSTLSWAQCDGVRGALGALVYVTINRNRCKQKFCVFCVDYNNKGDNAMGNWMIGRRQKTSIIMKKEYECDEYSRWTIKLKWTNTKKMNKTYGNVVIFLQLCVDKFCFFTSVSDKRMRHIKWTFCVSM